MGRLGCFVWAALLVGCSGSDAQSEPELDSGASTVDSSADEAAVDASEDSPTDSTPLDTATGGDAPTACACVDYSDPANVGTLPAVVTETSGLASSRKNPGVLYAHNDSGDSARVFALDSKGALLGEIAFGGATAVDWEDMAVGPCAEGSCVWIGDVGDNGKSRSNYALYSIPEPTLDGKTFAKTTIAAHKFPFSYPDGKWNCETLLVHPTTGEIFVVTKDSTIDGGVYRFPAKLVPGTPVTLEKVGSAKGTNKNLVTGGDISPCGDRILLRTYGPLYEYTIAPGKTVAEAFSVAPRSVPVAKEGQGEAVAFRADGRGYFTASEGTGVALSLTGCR